MSSTKISITQAARNLSEVVNRVAYRGESFLLIKGRKMVAELRPVLSGKKLRELPDILAAMPGLSEKEKKSFAGDLAHLRKKTRPESVADPWES